MTDETIDDEDADDERPGPLADLIPPDPLMAWPWYASLRHALTNAAMLAVFRAETGVEWTPGATGLERAIDGATGADLAFLRAFARWHNDRIWGDINLRAGEDTGEDE